MRASGMDVMAAVTELTRRMLIPGPEEVAQRPLRLDSLSSTGSSSSCSSSSSSSGGGGSGVGAGSGLGAGSSCSSGGSVPRIGVKRGRGAGGAHASSLVASEDDVDDSPLTQVIKRFRRSAGLSSISEVPAVALASSPLASGAAVPDKSGGLEVAGGTPSAADGVKVVDANGATDDVKVVGAGDEGEGEVVLPHMPSGGGRAKRRAPVPDLPPRDAKRSRRKK